MRHTFLPNQYLQATSGWNILATVHCEAERNRSEQIAEDDFLQELHDTTRGRFPAALVAHVDFLQPDRDQILTEHAKRALVRGIRSKPAIAGGPGERAPLPGSLQDPK